VIIPQANVKNLMLKGEVREAVSSGQFHVWSVEHVDQGIELLTGVPAGVRLSDGRWPESSINGLVDKRLQEMAESARKFVSKNNGNKGVE